jgi:hypothetical protein
MNWALQNTDDEEEVLPGVDAEELEELDEEEEEEGEEETF